MNEPMTPMEVIEGLGSHVLAMRAVLTAILAEHPVSEALCLQVLEPLLPRDRAGQVQLRQECSMVVADIMTAASLLDTKRSRPSRPKQ